MADFIVQHISNRLLTRDGVRKAAALPPVIDLQAQLVGVSMEYLILSVCSRLDLSINSVYTPKVQLSNFHTPIRY